MIDKSIVCWSFVQLVLVVLLSHSLSLSLGESVCPKQMLGGAAAAAAGAPAIA